MSAEQRALKFLSDEIDRMEREGLTDTDEYEKVSDDYQALAMCLANQPEEEKYVPMDSFEKLALDSYGWLLDTDMFFSIPQEDRLEVLVELASAAVSEEYVDNFRVFPATKQGKKEFNKIRDKGCCGSCDNYMTATSGRSYFYGFNYGH